MLFRSRGCEALAGGGTEWRLTPPLPRQNYRAWRRDLAGGESWSFSPTPSLSLTCSVSLLPLALNVATKNRNQPLSVLCGGHVFPKRFKGARWCAVVFRWEGVALAIKSNRKTKGNGSLGEIPFDMFFTGLGLKSC